MKVSWLMLGVMAISASITVASAMRISPKRASTHHHGQVELMCKINHPVTGCSFKVLHDSTINKVITEYQIIDLGTQPSATFQRPAFSAAVFQAKYHGQGLDQGECGLKMFGLAPGLYFVGCRVRTATSGWTYDYMALAVHSSGGSGVVSKELRSEDEFETVLVNGNRLITRPLHCKLNKSRRECHMLPNKKDVVIFNSQESNNKVDLNFNVTLDSVTSGGVMWCLCRDAPDADFSEFDVKIVTVVKPPEIENLKTASTNYTEGDTLTATCVAKYARPVARIVWKLGDDVVRNDSEDDNVDDARLDAEPGDLREIRADFPWRWPWSKKSVKQVLKQPMLSLKDNGKNLICQVVHPALENGVWTSHSSKITVHPLAKEEPSVNIFHSTVFLVAVALSCGAVLGSTITCAAIYWARRKKPSTVYSMSTMCNQNFDTNQSHYEDINTGMNPTATSQPAVPGRLTDIRDGRTPLMRQLACQLPAGNNNIGDLSDDVDDDGYLTPFSQASSVGRTR